MKPGLKLRSVGSYINVMEKHPQKTLSFMYIILTRLVYIPKKEMKKVGDLDMAISVAG
jgi:hypothetical protein